MTLYEKIKELYPKINERDFIHLIILQDDSDGRGAYIAKWDHPTFPRPTEEELEG